MGREKSLTVRGRYAEIQRLCTFVSNGARQAGFSEDSIFQIELACDEACTNIIEHTYGGEDEGEITVRWQVENRTFVVSIEDNGQRFDPGQIPPPPMPPGSPAADNEFEIQVGGLGVFFMRELMDEVEFSYEAGKGNVLTMEKQLPGEA
jgi:anti-sigma regulatory factor (Ser/Thr protein kinase)